MSQFPPPYGQYQPQSPPPPPKKSNTGKMIALVAAVVILLCCCAPAVAVVVFRPASVSEFFKGVSDGIAADQPTEAKVGDCVKKVAEGAKAKLTVVDCSSSDAAGRVFGIVSGVSEARFNADDIEETCMAYPEVKQAYWEGRTSATGKVWCIGDLS